MANRKRFEHFTATQFVEGILPVHAECGIVTAGRDACAECTTDDVAPSAVGQELDQLQGVTLSLIGWQSEVKRPQW